MNKFNFIWIFALFLLFTKIISLHIPLSFIGTVGIITWIFGKEGFFKGDFIFNILAGGVILGAFFMATDYVTAPITTKGRFIFGLGCGIMTVLIRYYGGFPEGVNCAILLMNMLTPMIDKYARPRLFGARRKNG